MNHVAAKPSRAGSLENLTKGQLVNKRADIAVCLSSAKTDEAKETFKEQLEYCDAILNSVEQIKLVFERGADSSEGAE